MALVRTRSPNAGIAYGVLVWGFAMYWLVLALITTVRAAHAGMPFALSWWSFTFPVGVLIAGTDALYAATGAVLFQVVATALLALLATTWTIVATRTARGAVRELALQLAHNAPLPKAA